MANNTGNGKVNGNGNALTAGGVITICLAMLVASNGVMFWGLSNLKEQINEKSADRYTGTEAKKDLEIVEGHFDNIEWRMQQVEQYIKDQRDEARRMDYVK